MPPKVSLNLPHASFLVNPSLVLLFECAPELRLEGQSALLGAQEQLLGRLQLALDLGGLFKEVMGSQVYSQTVCDQVSSRLKSDTL